MDKWRESCGVKELEAEVRKALQSKGALRLRLQKSLGFLADESGSLILPKQIKLSKIGKIFCKKVGSAAATCGVIAFDIGGLWWLSKEERDALERFNKCMKEKLDNGVSEKSR